MKNSELVRAFYQGDTRGSASNLRIEGNRLINYNTCIAERTEHGDFWLNVTRYSSSTSRIQGYLSRFIPENKVIRVADCKMGIQSLKEAVFK